MNKTYTEFEVLQKFKEYLKTRVDSDTFVYIHGNADSITKDFENFLTNGGK